MLPKRVLQNPTNTIRKCLSVESCVSSTVDLLRQTLNPLPESSTKSVQLPASKAQPAGVKELLPLLERSRFAVEVINTCLRCLAGSTSKTSDGITKPKSSGEVPKVRKTGRLVSANAIHSRSTNSNDSRSIAPDTIDNLSSCCSISISFLISIESAAGVPEMQLLQTENARLSLSSKLIRLGKYGTALKELKMLKRRLLAVMGKVVGLRANGIDGGVPSKTVNSGCKVIGDSEVHDPEFSTLLEFSQISTSSMAFPLVIACQLSMLRCVAGLKRPDLIEVRLEYWVIKLRSNLYIGPYTISFVACWTAFLYQRTSQVIFFKSVGASLYAVSNIDLFYTVQFAQRRFQRFR
jgi:separase